jgi:hypothetical protein
MEERPKIPWVAAGALAGVYILGALLEYFNWTPFW